MALSFTDALNEARRRAVLTGIPLTDQETAGLTNGWFNAQAGLASQRRANKLAEEQLAQNRWATEAQLDAAEKASNKALAGNIGASVVQGLGTDYINKPEGESYLAKGANYAVDTYNGLMGNAAPSFGATEAPIGSFAMGGSKDAIAPLLSSLSNTGSGIGELSSLGANTPVSMAPELAKDLISQGSTELSSLGTLAPESSFAITGNAPALSSSLSTTAPSAGFSAYLGPAGAGFAAPGLINAIHKDSTENLV